MFIRIDNNYLSQFYPVLLDAHFAAFMGPVTFAGIIVIGVAVFAGAAIANHRLAAVAAKQFSCQQEKGVTLSCRGVLMPD